MSLSLLKLSSTRVLTKNFLKTLTRRPFSFENSPQERKIRQINLLGTAGIATILVTSYFLIKKGGQDEKNTSATLQETNKGKINKLLEGTSSMKVIDPRDKEYTIREKYNFINKVVKQCAPAVFYLEIRDPYRKDLETGEPIITSNGSGFVISEDGWALTNAHVVLNKPQSTITAVMRDGSSYKVNVEDADMNLDLALLKLECPGKLPSLQFAKPGDTMVGEWVIALGSPLSLSNSVTVGIVSCVNRPAEDLGLRNFSMTYIQTDASITFGNSGGPLVNLDGDVIGINNLRLTSGISFAIPVEYVRKFLENSKYRVKAGKNSGVLGKTLFGITTISISTDLLTEIMEEFKVIPNDVSEGLFIWKVLEGTLASECGMEVGDIITHINGIAVKDPSELYLLSSPNEDIEIKLIHKGQKKIIKLHT
ncbi:serine protease HTRA2, mitochondrial-like [Anoplophora glabripennis]|uniref:serine protease HTRA2, mitochondrial-like n=1 Tax=Anoplophora glabripennis TaxID=217634 RepID=UPI00087588EC|nr:serine protease HTRA2, mitochondrial-like [Anoplophora glabripennis]